MSDVQHRRQVLEEFPQSGRHPGSLGRSAQVLRFLFCWLVVILFIQGKGMLWSRDTYGEHLGRSKCLANQSFLFNTSMRSSQASPIAYRSCSHIVRLPIVQPQVPSTSNGSQRAIPHIFRPGFSDKNMMANITIPMENSVAFKKLIRKKASWARWISMDLSVC